MAAHNHDPLVPPGVEMKTMNLKVADGLVIAGGGGIGVSSLINLYTVNQWIVIGIIVGMICSLVGCLAGIVIRFMWMRARVRILKDSIRLRDESGKKGNVAREILMDPDRE